MATLTLTLLLGLCLLGACVVATPLDDYVAKPDSNYKWTDTGSQKKLLCTNI